MIRILLLAAALPTLLASCAGLPARQLSSQSSLQLPPAEPGFISNMLTASAPVSLAASKPQPHERRHERLTLQEALDVAERLHPELAAAGALINAAEGRALQAGLFPNPELLARIESAPLTGSFAEQAEYVLGISQAFPLSERLAVARRAEALDRDRLAYAWESKRRAVRGRVQSAFAFALYRQGLIHMRAEDVELAKNGVAVSRARLAAGDIIAAEVGQAEVELGQARLALNNATAMHVQAMEALATAMGDPAIQVESLEGSLEESLVLPSLESLLSQLEQNPVLTAVETDITVQKTRLELAEIQRTPDVNFDLSYRRLGNVENAVDFGVRLPIPLFNRNQGRVLEARAEVAAAEARAREVRNEVVLNLQASYRKLARAVSAAILLREEILPKAEGVLQSAEARYANGDIRLAELLSIRRDWTRARLDYLDALNEVMQAWAELSPYVR